MNYAQIFKNQMRLPLPVVIDFVYVYSAHISNSSADLMKTDIKQALIEV